ncbi:MAG TPA: hypothetical protein VNN79_07120 [Actinomycetota bacterium]|nr:hypothetical protein [Actinomycetota bacterium]
MTTGANHVAQISRGLPVEVPARRFITATATDPAGNTSEFSACRKVT